MIENTRHDDIESRSAYERVGQQELDPRCTPVKLNGEVPQGPGIPCPDYNEEDRETWRRLYARQVELLQGRACDDYLVGLAAMHFDPSRIPALHDVDHVLHGTTGWRVARIPGLLHERDFFAFLARRVFPSTDYIRPRNEMDYTPAPDLFHDIFGHTPLITHPLFADFYQRMGEAALHARGADRRKLERFYWFTVEFGLIDTPEGLRVYGNGILSSHSEALHSLTDAVRKKPFDAETIAVQEYDVWHLQPLLFVIDSFEQLAEGFELWAGDHGWL